MNQVLQLWQEIQNPSEEFTPIPFWFFNDMPDEDRIRRQLTDYVEKGVNGIVLHPRIGVPEEVPYLSESYFKAVRFIVKTASELHMQVVLYDEGMYPSGSAHGMVVAKNPEFASKGVIIMQAEELQEAVSERNEKSAVEELCVERLVTEKSALTKKTVLTKYGKGEIITQFSDGRYLVYTFTGGTIRGIHFGEDDKQAGAPKSANILNPDAVDEFIRLTHDRYYEELKEYFGNTVIAFFTDEPSALGRNASRFREWIPGLENEILEKGGQLEELKGLFTKEPNATTDIYHKLIKKHLREIFYRRLSEWCESHGIGLMGHPEVSDDVEEQLYFRIPGQDLIMRRVAPETGGLMEFDSVQAKLAADIARHLGRRRNANECFGVCFRDKIPWYFKAEDMKWYLDWMGIRGVNLFVPHAFYYSVAGARKEERPPDVGPNNIWWPHYKRFSDYMKRLSYLMTDSVNSAKVAVLCDNNQVPYKELTVLFENQVEFNYLPIALLPECRVEEGKLCIREYRYEAVLNVTNPEWDKWLQEVVACKSNPDREIIKDNCSAEVAFCGIAIYHSAEEVLARTVVLQSASSQPAEGKKVACKYATVYTWEYTPNLRVSGLKKYGTQLYLFSNEGQQYLETKVTVPTSSGKEMASVILADLWRGEARKVPVEATVPVLSENTSVLVETNLKEVSEAIDVVTVNIQLQPRQTVLVILDEGIPNGNGETEPSLAAQLCQEKEEKYLGDFTERFTLIEKKDNRAVYTMKYQADSVTGTEVFSVDAEEMVECYCNGKLTDVGFWSPYRLRIGEHLTEGMNEIKLVVTGNAANVFCDADIPYGLGVN